MGERRFELLDLHFGFCMNNNAFYLFVLLDLLLLCEMFVYFRSDAGQILQYRCVCVCVLVCCL